MSATHQPRPTTAGAARARSSASAPTGRPASSPTPRSSSSIDSSRRVDPRALRHRRAPDVAAADESVVDMSVVAAEKALAAAPASPPTQIGWSSSRPSPTCCQTPSAAAARRRPHRRHRTRRRSTSPPRAPASATALALANDMVRGGSAEHVLVVGVEKLTDMVDPYDRGTAFIFGDGAGAVVVGPSRRPRHRPGRLGRRRQRRPTRSRRTRRGTTLARRPRARVPVAVDERPAGVPLGRLRDGPGRPAGARRGRRERRRPRRRSSRTRPTCASSTRWSRSSGCPSTSPSPGTSSTPATPPRRRSRWRWPRCSRAARRRSGDTALLIGFGAGLVVRRPGRHAALSG